MFRNLFLTFILIFGLSASAQVNGATTKSAPGGFSGSAINHTVVCDSYYSTVQACVVAAGTNMSIIIPFGQHVGESYTNTYSVAILDMRNLAQNLVYSSPCGASGAPAFRSPCSSGGVTSFTANPSSWPSWLIPTVSNPTTAPTLSVAVTAIPNSALANSSTLINGQTCTLGQACTIPAGQSIAGSPYNIPMIGSDGESAVASPVSVQGPITFTAYIFCNTNPCQQTVIQISPVPPGILGANVQSITDSMGLLNSGTTVASVAYGAYIIPSQNWNLADGHGGVLGDVFTVTYISTPAVIVPTSLYTKSLDGYLYASQNTSSPGALDGVANLLASPALAGGGVVYADPNDGGDKGNTFLGETLPDDTLLKDERTANRTDFYQNVGYPNTDFLTTTKNTGGTTHQVFWTRGENGYAIHGGEVPGSTGEYEESLFDYSVDLHDAGLVQFEGGDGVISKPDDINFHNWYLKVNPYSVAGADEGFVWERIHINALGPWFGYVGSYQNSNVNTINFTPGPCCGSQMLNMYTEILDLSAPTLKGNVTYSAAYAPIDYFNGAKVLSLTVDATVPASLVGYLPAQANIEGIVFAASTQGSAGQDVNVNLVAGSNTSDSAAITGAGTDTLTVQLVNSSGGTRTLADIVTLFGSYSSSATTTDGGVITAFLATGITGTTLASAGSAGLEGIQNPPLGGGSVVTSFAVVMPSTPIVGALMDIAGPSHNDVLSPSAVSLVSSNTYAVTGRIYYGHWPTAVFQNTSTTPGSGMVGRAMVLPQLTSYSSQRQAQEVLGAIDAHTIVVGQTGFGSLTTFGVPLTGTQPAIFYIAAQIQALADPTKAQKLHTEYTDGDSYAEVQDHDFFLAGDELTNPEAFSQTYQKETDLMGFPNPLSSYGMRQDVISGPGVNGEYQYTINDNPDSFYAGASSNLTEIAGINAYSITSNVGTFFYSYYRTNTDGLVSGQNVTISGFGTSTFLNNLNGTATTGATNVTFNGTATAGSNVISGATVTTGYGYNSLVTCTGTGVLSGGSANIVTGISGSNVSTQFAATTSGAVSCTATTEYFTMPVTHADQALLSEAGGVYTNLPGVALPNMRRWDGPVGNVTELTEYPKNLVAFLTANGTPVWNPNQTGMGIVQGLLDYRRNVSAIDTCSVSGGVITITNASGFPLQGSGPAYAAGNIVDLNIPSGGCSDIRNMKVTNPSAYVFSTYFSVSGILNPIQSTSPHADVTSYSTSGATIFNSYLSLSRADNTTGLSYFGWANGMDIMARQGNFLDLMSGGNEVCTTAGGAGCAAAIPDGTAGALLYYDGTTSNSVSASPLSWRNSALYVPSIEMINGNGIYMYDGATNTNVNLGYSTDSNTNLRSFSLYSGTNITIGTGSSSGNPSLIFIPAGANRITFGAQDVDCGYLIAVGNCSFRSDFEGDVNVNSLATIIGTALDSTSGTIAPTTGFAHVTGTGIVSTITVPGFCTAALTSCSVKFIPDAVWTTLTTGNIALASTAAVNRVIEFDYDPATAKWYPSY
jgi:hypothetical protein